MENKNEFAELFNKTRLEKEITYRTIKEATGVSIGYLCDFAAGRKNLPENKIVAAIEEVLGITDRSLQIAAIKSRKPNREELQAEIKRLKGENKELRGELEAFKVCELCDEEHDWTMPFVCVLKHSAAIDEINLLREQLKAREWVKVEDGLPPIGVNCLWQQTDGSYFIGYRENSVMVLTPDGFSGDFISRFAAWTSLPEPFSIEAEGK